ncbi:hypothetical protein [Polyangium jinanense]|uniref:STAS/SEC14 domain-containing protein n=1 Tax=Polyangium jinanense TaxID=2829994 RepID=A0A9X3X727_9BACT|nr:hypothetical protein [Polyangium jinanense]MDC3955942.1 hypothetical protein [Polyangium jinanense]MDC3985119.1 hypothetical protein [Polyangium jinanense]
MSQEVVFGTHRLVFEDPDLVFIDLHGDIGDEISPMIRDVVTWTLSKPYVLVLVPLGRSGHLSTAGWKLVRAPDPRMPPRAIATYGGGFATRIALDMAMRATVLLGNHKRLLFHGKDEVEARAWLAGAREKLARIAEGRVSSY